MEKKSRAYLEGSCTFAALKKSQVFKSNSTQNSQICTYLSKYSSQPGHILSKSEKNSLASLHFYYIFRNNSCLHCYFLLHYYYIFQKIPTYTIIPAYIFILFLLKFSPTLLFSMPLYSAGQSTFKVRSFLILRACTLSQMFVER